MTDEERVRILDRLVRISDDLAVIENKLAAERAGFTTATSHAEYERVTTAHSSTNNARDFTNRAHQALSVGL